MLPHPPQGSSKCPWEQERTVSKCLAESPLFFQLITQSSVTDGRPRQEVMPNNRKAFTRAAETHNSEEIDWLRGTWNEMIKSGREEKTRLVEEIHRRRRRLELNEPRVSNCHCLRPGSGCMSRSNHRLPWPDDSGDRQPKARCRRSRRRRHHKTVLTPRPRRLPGKWESLHPLHILQVHYAPQDRN